jgi:GT2 family glycosyltransferase
MITVIVTSSNRFDLLERTLDSFLALNTYPIEKYIINEDSGNVECVKKIIDKYGHLFHVLFHPKREGLSTALDNLMLHVTTPYVFNIEDDWEFFGNPNFMQESLDILEKDYSTYQVWIRDKNDHKHPLSKKNNLFDLVSKGYQGHWGGFSFNPSLRRFSDIKMIFPNGFKEFGDEALCSKQAESFNYKAVSLTNPAIRHIGYGRHTENFKQ